MIGSVNVPDIFGIEYSYPIEVSVCPKFSFDCVGRVAEASIYPFSTWPPLGVQSSTLQKLVSQCHLCCAEPCGTTGLEPNRPLGFVTQISHHILRVCVV